jgi:hypothetical protein
LQFQYITNLKDNWNSICIKILSLAIFTALYYLQNLSKEVVKNIDRKSGGQMIGENWDG